MLNRRDFLKGVLGTATALAVIPNLESLPLIASTPEEFAAWNNSYMALLKEAHRLFHAAMTRGGINYGPGDVDQSAMRLGSTHACGARVTDWLNICAGAPIEGQLELVPAMEALADHAVSVGMDAYASPPLVPGVEYAGRIGPLRMIVAFNVLDDITQTRFDVVGGSRPNGQGARARERLLAEIERQRRAELKRDIRMRLASGIYTPRPIPC